MDIDHIFNNQFELDEHCMALPEARTLMARHLEGEDIGVRLHEVRRVLKKNNVLPIGGPLAKKRMADDIKSYGVDNVKRQKSATDDATFFNGLHTGPEWVAAFAARLAVTDDLLTKSVAKVKEDLFKLNVATFDKEAAIDIENRIQAVASALGNAFDFNVNGTKRLDVLNKATISLDRMESEFAFHVLDEKALEQYYSKKDNDTILFFARHIVNSFKNGDASTLIDEQFSKSAPDIGMMIKAGIREQQAARAAKLGIQYKTRTQFEEVVDTMGGLAERAASMTPDPGRWKKLVAAIFVVMKRKFRWSTENEMKQPHIEEENAEGDDEDDEEEDDVEGEVEEVEEEGYFPVWIINVLKFIIGLALTALPVYKVYVEIKANITPDQHLEDVRTQIAQIQNEIQGAVTLDAQGIEMLKEQIAKTEEITTAISDKMSVFETGEYLKKNLVNGNAVMVPDLLPQLKTIQSDVVDMFDNVQKAQEEKVETYKENVNIQRSKKEEDEDEVLRIRRYKEEYAEEMEKEHPNVDNVIWLIDTISRKYFGSSVSSTFKSITKDTADLLDALKLFTEKHEKLNRSIQNGLEQLKKVASSADAAIVAHEQTKNKTPVYDFLLDWFVRKTSEVLPFSVNSSFMGMLDAMGLNTFREMELTLTYLTNGLKEMSERNIANSLFLVFTSVSAIIAKFGFMVITSGVVRIIIKVMRFVHSPYTTLLHLIAQSVHEALYYFHSWLFGKGCTDQRDKKKCEEENRAAFERHGGWLLTFIDNSILMFGGSAIPLAKISRVTQVLSTVYAVFNIAKVVWPLLWMLGSSIIVLGIPMAIGGALAVGAFAFLIVKSKAYSILNQITNWYILHPASSTVVIVGVQLLIAMIIKVGGYEEYLKFTFEPVDEKANLVLENGGFSNALEAYGIAKEDPRTQQILRLINQKNSTM